MGIWTPFAAALLIVGARFEDPRPPPSAPLRAVPFTAVQLTDGFFAPRLETNRTVTIPACLTRCRETGRLKNFDVASGRVRGGHEGALYNDSDVYKVIEGIGYTLALHKDPALEAEADRIIDSIAAAHQLDGYLDTYFTLVEPTERWKNIRSGHELYCAGHLIEAAVAYQQATGKRQLYDVALRLAACIDKEFGWGKHEEPTGHPELELALMKLFRQSGDERWARLAKFFVDVRGKKERKSALFGEYAQDHLPVREQREIVGHAVRAMYLYSGMADVAAWSGDATLFTPLEALWRDVTERRMYITGGIGNSAANEGFTVPFELPNDTAYCETCAGIGLALWNQRMFLGTRDPKYLDVMEQVIDNNVLAGLSRKGDAFFYDNVLESDGDHQRVPWFDCSCCPSNLVRFLPAMGERVYATDGESLYVCMFVDSTAELTIKGKQVRVKQSTKYPWSGDVSITIEAEGGIEFPVFTRVPIWVKGGVSEWQRWSKPWTAGQKIDLALPMLPTRSHPDKRVAADKDRVALTMGPIVYCIEGVDHGGHVLDLAEPEAPKASFESALLGGVNVLRTTAQRVQRDAQGARVAEDVALTAIPYCLWCNREPGEMQVWIPGRQALAKIAGEGPIVEQNGVKLSASHCNKNDTLFALNDGQLPKSSSDDSIPRMTFWDHRGTKEWVQLDFQKPTQVSEVRVYWFDDSGHGACRVPAAWRVMLRDATQWKPVTLRPSAHYRIVKDGQSVAEFAAVTTNALRIEVDLQAGMSGGILELQTK